MTVDTIYALATPRAPAALAVFRVSGPEADRVLARVIGSRAPAPRRASLRRLSHPETGERVDDVVVTRFAAGASYTGEAAFELSSHGGLAVIDAVADALSAAGARLAEPGEFTRRAHLNGKLDLAQAEAVADLIAAEEVFARRRALAALDGAVGAQVEAWRRRIVEAAALLETGVDFVDEALGEDLDAEAAEAVRAIDAALAAELAGAAAGAEFGDFTVALIGPPNAGKSSVLNALAQRDAAIVSARAGTTRDPVVVSMLIDGRRVSAVDTAGLRESADEIEAEGVRRSERRADEADLRILVMSPDTWPEGAAALSRREPGDLLLWNKADLGVAPPETLDGAAIASTRDGTARAAVVAAISEALGRSAAPVSSVASTARRRDLVAGAREETAAALADILAGRPETAISRLYAAVGRLGRLTSAMDHDEVLELVFSRFCVGK